MKILVFCETFAPPTLTFIYNEVNTLAQKNDVLILTTKRMNEHLFPFEKIVEVPFYQNNIEYRIRKTLRARDLEFGVKKSSFEKKIKSIVNDFQPDVIHCHFGYESWLFLLNFDQQKIPIFLHFHGFDASHKLTSLRYCKTLDKILERSDVTPIFVSNFMHKNVEKHLNRKIENWKLLYYGTDCDFFTRIKKQPDKNPFVFLQISSFTEKKGHEFTVKAFKKLIESKPDFNCKMIFGGDGTLRKEIEMLVQELDIQHLVEFKGTVNRQEAKDLMENAHCFLHHSVTSYPIGDMEGIPNAIMEAMSMQLPILSTFHSGIPELVENGKHGFLVAERDIDDYAAKMRAILSWNYLPENREKVIQGFEKQQHGKLLENYYEEKIKSPI
jgi:colanic acid/amylovoran biosynthesis glycosyltransferase